MNSSQLKTLENKNLSKLIKSQIYDKDIIENKILSKYIQDLTNGKAL